MTYSNRDLVGHCFARKTLPSWSVLSQTAFVRQQTDYEFPSNSRGYIPQIRALLCRKEWTQLNYGWWTLLEPHLTDSSKKETKAARQQSRKDLEDENKALPAKIRQVRGG